MVVILIFSYGKYSNHEIQAAKLRAWSSGLARVKAFTKTYVSLAILSFSIFTGFKSQNIN